MQLSILQHVEIKPQARILLFASLYVPEANGMSVPLPSLPSSRSYSDVWLCFHRFFQCSAALFSLCISTSISIDCFLPCLKSEPKSTPTFYSTLLGDGEVSDIHLSLPLHWFVCSVRVTGETRSLLPSSTSQWFCYGQDVLSESCLLPVVPRSET